MKDILRLVTLMYRSPIVDMNVPTVATPPFADPEPPVRTRGGAHARRPMGPPGSGRAGRSGGPGPSGGPGRSGRTAGVSRTRRILAVAGSTTRAVFAPLVTALAICAIFVSVYLAAFHAPVAHGQPIGIAASDQVAASTQTAIDHISPGAFTFTRYPDATAALDAVTHDRVPAVLVDDAQGARLIVAGAQGPSLVQVVSTTVAKAVGHPVAVQDVDPLSTGDTRGLSAFYAAFGVVLAGFLFSVSTHQALPRMPLAARAGATLAFAVVSGVLVSLIADTATKALPAPFLTVATVMGLLAWASACAAGMLLRLFGKLGVPVASILLLTLGNATSGGTLPVSFLPPWLAPLAHFMPPAAAVQGLRGASYFHDAHLVSSLMILIAWAIGCLAVHHGREVHATRRARSARSAEPVPATAVSML